MALKISHITIEDKEKGSGARVSGFRVRRGGSRQDAEEVTRAVTQQSLCQRLFQQSLCQRLFRVEGLVPAVTPRLCLLRQLELLPRAGQIESDELKVKRSPSDAGFRVFWALGFRWSPAQKPGAESLKTVSISLALMDAGRVPLTDVEGVEIGKT